MTPSPFSIGIDIGGTKISSALVNTETVNPDEQLSNFQELPTPKESKPFLEALLTLIEKQRAANSNVNAIGISTAGIVDFIHGKVLGSTGNLPGIRGVENLKELLEEKTGLLVYVENDANAAAYGECRAGAGRSLQDMVMVTLGTGVGTGIVVHGNMVRGGHFSAGEGGHIPISNAHERDCTCGRKDCWEAFASGTGLALTTKKSLEKASEADRSAFLAISGKSLEDVHTHELIDAHKKGDKLAKEILTAWHHHVALGLRAILNLLDPDAIVIGGGLAQFVDFEQLTKITEPQAMISGIRLIPATLGNQAGIVGAAFLAHEAAQKARMAVPA
ncbi:MAG: ROK family protein [Vampirovibrionales bacterium]|nr:ROK family protein [Vampirovibrionales bacterium]